MSDDCNWPSWSPINDWYYHLRPIRSASISSDNDPQRGLRESEAAFQLLIPFENREGSTLFSARKNKGMRRWRIRQLVANQSFSRDFLCIHQNAKHFLKQRRSTWPAHEAANELNFATWLFPDARQVVLKVAKASFPADKSLWPLLSQQSMNDSQKKGDDKRQH